MMNRNQLNLDFVPELIDDFAEIADYDCKERGYQINTPEYINLENSTQAIGFFSGAGGLDIGSVLAGIPVISCLDFDGDSVKTLRKNKVFARSEHHCQDISSVTAEDYTKTIKDNNPSKLILLGGPPCQPFSKAGYWIGNQNRQANDDPRNMIYQYLRLIEDLKPDGFLLENVESILHPTNVIAVENLTEAIDKLGYRLKMVRSNAIDYGVPQRRKRVFFIASRKPFMTNSPVKTHGSEEECLYNPKLYPHERVVDWLHPYKSDEFFEREELANHGTYYEDLVAVPPGKNYIALTAHAGYPNPKFIAQKRFWSFLLKLHPLETSWTIAAQPGPWVGPFHWSSRRLRVPEIAALQTFPNDYKFVGSRRSVQKQIGNAVPPLLGKAMIDFLSQNS